MKANFTLLTFALLSGTLTFGKIKQPKTGLWKAQLTLNSTYALPFQMTLDKSKQGPELTIINGNEEIVLTQFQYDSDSIIVPFPAFASELKFKVSNKKSVKGFWYNHAKKGNYYLPFTANFAPEEGRYPDDEVEFNVDGKWEVIFDYHKENSEKAIGVFNNCSTKCGYGAYYSNKVIGTFLTETGDYRFLEGATINDSLYLSTFDGSHAFLFTAKYKNDTLWGNFLSGKHYETKWYAVKNENVSIGNPDSLTYLVNKDPISFSLPNADGGTFNYPADAVSGKVTLIQILGTWCPNCLDESRYIKTLRAKYPEELEVIAVAFETQKDTESRIQKVNDYRKNLNLDYQFVIGGSACKSCANELFPMLNEIISFPTLIVIDKKGEIRKIHTGFNGPGTGKYYDDFVTETNAFIQELIEE